MTSWCILLSAFWVIREMGYQMDFYSWTLLASLVDPIGFGAQGLRTNFWCDTWMDYFGSLIFSHISLHARITRITFIHHWTITRFFVTIIHNTFIFHYLNIFYFSFKDLVFACFLYLLIQVWVSFVLIYMYITWSIHEALVFLFKLLNYCHGIISYWFMLMVSFRPLPKFRFITVFLTCAVRNLL